MPNKPVVYAGAVGLAALLVGISYFTVFAGNGAPQNGLELAAASVANTGSGASKTGEETAVAGSKVRPVSVKTISITPEMLQKGLSDEATVQSAALIKPARWGYNKPEASRGQGSATDDTVKSAYAATGAAAARPWPITAGKVDNAGDVPEKAAAEPEAQAPAKETPAKAKPAAVAKGTVKYRSTVNDHVNMRYGPSSHNGVITVIPKGTTVGVVECKSWCKVDLNGRQGWIYGRFLGSKQAAATQSASDAAQADAAPAVVKPEPDDTSKTQFEKMKENF